MNELNITNNIISITGILVSTIAFILAYITYKKNIETNTFNDIFKWYHQNEKLIEIMHIYVYNSYSKKYRKHKKYKNKKIQENHYIQTEQLLTIFDRLCDLYYMDKISDINFSYIEEELNEIAKSTIIINFINENKYEYVSLSRYICIK